MYKIVDINLGAGGRNIHKQASKNLYTTVQHQQFCFIYYWLGDFRDIRGTEFFYGQEQVFIHESGMTMQPQCFLVPRDRAFRHANEGYMTVFIRFFILLMQMLSTFELQNVALRKQVFKH